jgi:hypothetical protein
MTNRREEMTNRREARRNQSPHPLSRSLYSVVPEDVCRSAQLGDTPRPTLS